MDPTRQLDSFTRSTGYSGALAVHNKENVLETRFKNAGTDRCAAAGIVTDEETVTVSTRFSQVAAVLSSIAIKKPEVDAILLIRPGSRATSRNWTLVSLTKLLLLTWLQPMF
ncbi:hypothetical protein MAM1_0108d05498 [Mucor ambiguus]|uniref:Uncharacterized protein n=1 Tax=Mucor ambiguus TaxID=91626 RepID=A0A0C9MRS8_9FUNG|nr:hypothetical protein MAM1_0108d05498 [Mucor ambiguus]